MELIDIIFLILIIGISTILNIYKIFINITYESRDRRIKDDWISLIIFIHFSLITSLYITVRPIYYLLNN